MSKATKLKEREFIVNFIHLYRDLPSLWNVKSKDYHNRDKKNAAYEILLSKYKEMYPGSSKDDVKKKINTLRTNYRKELKKHLLSKKSGSRDDIYIPTLWYYNDFVFLQDSEFISESTLDAMDTSAGDPEHANVDYNSTQDSTPIKGVNNQIPSISKAVPTTAKKRKKNEDEHTEFVAKHLREKPDEYESWALVCAADLRKMEPIQQIFAKNAISAIIMEGRLGLLNRHSVKINAGIDCSNS